MPPNGVVLRLQEYLTALESGQLKGENLGRRGGRALKTQVEAKQGTGTL